MVKKYDMGKKSDMNKFGRDLMNSVSEQTLKALHNVPIQIKCPSCQSEFCATAGPNKCPHCGATVNLDLKIEKS